MLCETSGWANWVAGWVTFFCLRLTICKMHEFQTLLAESMWWEVDAHELFFCEFIRAARTSGRKDIRLIKIQWLISKSVLWEYRLTRVILDQRVVKRLFVICTAGCAEGQWGVVTLLWSTTRHRISRIVATLRHSVTCLCYCKSIWNTTKRYVLCIQIVASYESLQQVLPPSQDYDHV